MERVEKKRITGVTSASVVQEVIHRMMMVEAATILPEIKTKDLVKYLKAHTDIVKEMVDHQCIP